MEEVDYELLSTLGDVPPVHIPSPEEIRAAEDEFNWLVRDRVADGHITHAEGEEAKRDFHIAMTVGVLARGNPKVQL